MTPIVKFAIGAAVFLATITAWLWRAVPNKRPRLRLVAFKDALIDTSPYLLSSFAIDSVIHDRLIGIIGVLLSGIVATLMIARRMRRLKAVQKI